jgi:hypothetical protein
VFRGRDKWKWSLGQLMSDLRNGLRTFYLMARKSASASIEKCGRSFGSFSSSVKFNRKRKCLEGEISGNGHWGN